jgi:hypothetical protein
MLFMERREKGEKGVGGKCQANDMTLSTNHNNSSIWGQMKRCSIYVTKVKWIGPLVSMIREDCERVNTWVEIV